MHLMSSADAYSFLRRLSLGFRASHSLSMRIGLVVNNTKTQSARTRRWCKDFEHQLGGANHREQIKLRKPLFVRIETIGALLAIAGFHSVIGASAPGCYLWWAHYLTALKKGFQIGPEGYPVEEKEAAAHADIAAEMLLTVIGTDCFHAYPTRRHRDPAYAAIS
jgi:hypothetical protein